MQSMNQGPQSQFNILATSRNPPDSPHFFLSSPFI
jgi:hypothetical protein